MIGLISKIKMYGLRSFILILLLRFFSVVKVNFYRYLLSDNKPLLINTKVNQATHFLGKGTISVEGAHLGIWPSPSFIEKSGYIEARNPSSIISIGSSTYINNSFVIIADKEKVEIGSGCLIGPNFFVCDSDFHGLEIEDRFTGTYKCLSVKICDNVFIGEGVKILKGVTIGKGSVIGSGSVVVKDVDEYAIYAGNPAIKIRDLKYFK